MVRSCSFAMPVWTFTLSSFDENRFSLYCRTQPFLHSACQYTAERPGLISASQRSALFQAVLAELQDRVSVCTLTSVAYYEEGVSIMSCRLFK
jgi:hypothetical protein